MRARYLVRFDDISEHMNWEIWDEIENILDRHNIKPILAVIPDNKDLKLLKYIRNDGFIERLSKWREKGYHLAVHGYNHQYTNRKGGILNVSFQSEFAGLSYESQYIKLSKSVEFFNRYNIAPETFIAPSHSFDRKTLRCLNELNFKYISDGFFKNTLYYKRLYWIPVQIWERFINKKKGVWTICIHHNVWNNERLIDFEQDILKYKSHIIRFEDLVFKRDLVLSFVRYFNSYFGRYIRYLKHVVRGVLWKK